MEISNCNWKFHQVGRALTFSGKHVSFVLPANCDNRMVGLRESPQEEPHENKDAARRHSPPCQLHFWRILSVMTLALASISPAGSSASAYRIFMLNTLEPVISFKENIAPSPGGFPVKCRCSFVLTRLCRKGLILHDYSSSSLLNFIESTR